MADPVNVRDYESLATEALDAGVLSYFTGGAGDEWTLRRNEEAYRRLILRPRVLVDVGSVSPATEVLGHTLSMPVLVAPTALLRVAHPDGEPGVARAAAATGTLFTLSTLATAAPAEIAEAAPDSPRWFQLYCFRDRGLNLAVIDDVVAAGFSAIVLTVDVPYLGPREASIRLQWAIPEGTHVPAYAAISSGGGAPTPAEVIGMLDPSLTWRDLEQLADASPIPVLVKGILTPEDARLAVEHGAAGVIVSNHGGRQLDGVAASIEALPEVVEAVGDATPVLVDGGIRRGTDVVKALALGATATLVGRPVVWALAARGEEGVRHVLALLREEVRLALALLGCPTPADVTPAHVAPAA
ncbi:MAG: 4-hydroxymandelate oxidase [Candidatus Binatota bacterium]|nr:4-hydroxymandelate oxidase [Candidatus Binatota bacterium]